LRNWQPLPDESTTMVASATPREPVPEAPVQVAYAEPVVKTIVRTDPAKQAAAVRAAKASRAPAEQPYVTAAAAPAKGRRVAAKQTEVAMQEPMAEPDAARFGGTLNARYITSVPNAPQEASMGFQSTPENTDAIGAMIVSQGRPLEAN